jgi:glutamate/tyrosine decarboxylase-like PLP-dependent enzyme
LIISTWRFFPLSTKLQIIKVVVPLEDGDNLINPELLKFEYGFKISCTKGDIMPNTNQRDAILDMDPEEFRNLGHQVIDQVADFLHSLPNRPLTTAETPSEIRTLLGQNSLPEEGTDAGQLINQVAPLLFEHSLFNGHPKFWGYITASAAPIGILADLLVGSINPNLGAWLLSPVASEIEHQSIQWIADLVGFPSDCGGILVTGGNMANFVGFLCARHAQITRKEISDLRTLRLYASEETHTWIHKAVDMYGLGKDSVSWIKTDNDQKIDLMALKQQIEQDIKEDLQPFMIIGTAGSVSTGVVDPLPQLSKICKEYDIWFHVDGAYGAFAAALPDASRDLKGLALADSVALDPHKWLYAPLEAGCALVRDKSILRDTFSYHPPYYKFDEVKGERAISFVDYGPQNSRGFRALKVWLALRHAGRNGYIKMISDDIKLALYLFDLVDNEPELEACTHNLSITTFRYAPETPDKNDDERESYLNELNTELLTCLQEGGEAFVSNAVINGKYVLRACIVNFRTTKEDIEALPEIVKKLGREINL